MSFTDEFEKLRNMQKMIENIPPQFRDFKNFYEKSNIENFIEKNDLSRITQEFAKANSMSKLTKVFAENNTATLVQKLAKPTSSISNITKEFAKANSISKNISEDFGKSMGELRKALTPFTITSKLLQEAIPKNFKDIFSELRSQTLELSKIDFSGLNSLSKIFNDTDFNINSDGSISIENEVFSRDDISDNISVLLEDEIFLDHNVLLHEKINFIIKKIFTLSKKAGYNILLYIFYPFFMSFLYDSYVKPVIFKQTIKNSVKKSHLIKISINTTKKTTNKKLITFIRIVSVNELNVRLKNKIRSKKIDSIFLGKKVWAIKVKNNWTLIKYKNYGYVIYGWVVSKYLKKVTFRKSMKNLILIDKVKK